MFQSIEISLAAVVPAVLLLVYVFLKDRVEKEPIGLLAGLFGAGVVLYIPVYFLESSVIKLLDSLFSKYITYSTIGAVSFTSETAERVHGLLCYFIGVALLEECFKWVVLYLFTHKNKSFNYLFDGIVYSVFVSMGFAVAENLRYGFMDGWDTLLLRTLTSVPAHLLLGVIMGCIYTLWHTRYLGKIKERELAAKGLITVTNRINSAGWLILSLIAPVILHGLLAFVNDYDGKFVTFGFFVLTTVLYLACFIGIDHMSDADAENNRSVSGIIKRRYPQLKGMNSSELEGSTDSSDSTNGVAENE